MYRIVLSGSMKFLDKMNETADYFFSQGLLAIIPDEDQWDSIPSEQINDYKKQVSIDYFKKIAASDTDAVLVINEEKNSSMNYIGANSFAEIAIAFYFNKKIFLLNDIYPLYSDELIAWGVIPLFGNIENIWKYIT